MKHLIYSCRFALLMIMLTATLTSNAETVAGINYILCRTGTGDDAVADSAKVTGPTSFAGALNIPSTITVPYTYEKIVGYEEDWPHNPIYVTVTRDLTYPVTAINSEAFANSLGLSNITSVTIPNSVTRIGKQAFHQCDNIIGTVTIPSSVNNVGNFAFAGCMGISRVIINNSIIGDYEFMECSGLTEVIMNNLITSIGNVAFYHCTGLTGHLIIPNSVTTIGDHAFSNCEGLTGVTLSNSLITIRNDAFADCTGLTGHLIIPNSVTTIGEDAFRNCTGLTGVTLSNSMTSISDHAFAYCTGLTGQLDIPNSITNIERYAFSGCNSLTGVNLGNSVTTIGENAFYNCSGLTGELIIPNSVTSIGKSAFSGCSALTGLTIGNSVTKILNGAFSGTNIKEFTYNAKYCTSSSYNYMDISKVEKLTIGNEVEYLPKQFMYRSKITEVTFPESVNTIGQEAFCWCDSLKTVNWNSRNCLTEYSNDENDDLYWYYRLRYSPFWHCNKLSHIVIGKNVESIDDETFYIYQRVTPLDTVTCQSVVPSAITAACFNTDNSSYSNNVYDKTVLRIPKGSLQAYQEAEGWKEFNHIVEMDDSLQGDADGDGEVGIADVVLIIDYLLNSDATSLNLINADADNDGTITIADVVAIIDYLLAHHW